MFEFDKTNNARIIAQFGTAGGRGTRPGRVILVRKEHAIGEYVVAWQGVDQATGKWDVGWHHGDYCRDLAEGLESFGERVKKHCGLKSVIGFVHIPSQLYCCHQCKLKDSGNPVFEVLLEMGTECQGCEAVVKEDGWHKRNSIDAMQEAVAS
jgi:hypothetical protein